MWQFQGIYDGEEKILIIMKKDINYNSYSILAFIFLKLMSVSVQKTKNKNLQFKSWKVALFPLSWDKKLKVKFQMEPGTLF